MIFVKRTGLLFGVLLGVWNFKEEKIKERLSAAAFMMSGVFVIGFLGREGTAVCMAHIIPHRR